MHRPALLTTAVLLILLAPAWPAAGQAPEGGAPLAYRMVVTHTEAGFEGHLTGTAGVNGSVDTAGTLRGYLKGSGLGMNLRARYEGAEAREADGALASSRSYVRVRDIDLGDTHVEASERFTHTPPLRDRHPPTWEEGATWQSTGVMKREYERDGRGPVVMEATVTHHFILLGNRTFQVGTEVREGWGIRSDDEAQDTDGRYNITWFERATGITLEKSRYHGGEEVAKATLVPVAAAAPPRSGRGIPATGAVLLALTGAAAALVLAHARGAGRRLRR